MHRHAAREDVSDRCRLQLLHLSCEPLACGGWSPGAPDACHGGCAHRPPLDGSGTTVVSCSSATLDASQAARKACACTATPGSAVVCMTTVYWGATPALGGVRKNGRLL